MNAKCLAVTLMSLGLLAVAVGLGPAATRERRVPPVSDAISSYAARLKVGRAKAHANLALYPIYADGAKVPGVDLTLKQAMRKGLVEVAELSESEVNRIHVRNRAKEPLFIMAGEMLRGGKQDRIAGVDLIVPAQSKLTVPAFCIEHGRWAGREGGFSVGHSVAGAGVRGAARRGGQSAVWRKVEEQQEALHAPSATGALRSVHDSEEVREAMKPYLQVLSDLPEDDPRARGVVAVVDDRVMAADLFSSRELFREMWPDLLEAYVIDALEQQEVHPAHGHRPGEKELDTEAEDIQEWLGGLSRAAREAVDTPGEGDLYELRSRRLSGTGLVWQKGVVHLGLFPEMRAEEPAFNSLEFRRERLR